MKEKTPFCSFNTLCTVKDLRPNRHNKRLNSRRTYYVSGSLLNSLYRLSHLILSKQPHEVHSTAIPN